MKIKFFFVFVSVFILHSPQNLKAVQSNFMISPPPIPWFEFQKGQSDLRVSATGIYPTGESDNPEVSGDINIYGGGATAIYRYAFRDQFAFDCGANFAGATGDIGPIAIMDMAILSVPLDLEIQPFKTDKFAAIFFIGFNFSWSYIGIDVLESPYYQLDIYSSMSGPQGGVQASMKFTDFVFSPFFMITKLSGTSDIDIVETGEPTESVSMSISSSTSTYYGFDIVYLPFDLTLSSLISMAKSSDDNKGFTTYIFTVSLNF